MSPHADTSTIERAPSDPSAERETRRRERERRRGPRAERPEERTSSRRRRPPDAPMMRGVISAGIVGLAVVVAAIMGALDAQAWLIGLAVSVASLVLAATARHSRRA